MGQCRCRIFPTGWKSCLIVLAFSLGYTGVYSQLKASLPLMQLSYNLLRVWNNISAWEVNFEVMNGWVNSHKVSQKIRDRIYVQICDYKTILPQTWMFCLEYVGTYILLNSFRFIQNSWHLYAYGNLFEMVVIYHSSLPREKRTTLLGTYYE